MWLDTSAANSSTVGAFLFVSLTSLGLGALANLIRSLLVDPLQRRIGLPRREWKYSQLQANITAVEFLVVNQFRYYQFAGNLFVVIPFVAVCHAVCNQSLRWQLVVGWIVGEVILWFGARDSLRTYYRRLDEVLAAGPEPTLGVSAAPEGSDEAPRNPSSTTEDSTVGSGEN
jgi:hypothetical protein